MDNTFIKRMTVVITIFTMLISSLPLQAFALASPVITPIPAQTGTVGTHIMFSVTATNPNSATLAYSLSGTSVPAGAGINGSGMFMWTPTASGAYNFDVVITDPTPLVDPVTSPITITVNDVVAAPALAPILTSVSTFSNNIDPTIAVLGDTVTLNFTSDQPIDGVGLPVVTLYGQPATVTGSGSSFTATATITIASAASVEPLYGSDFTIDFTNAAGLAGLTVTATTDSSKVTYAGLAKFVDALPIPAPIAPLSTLPDGTKYYEIAMTAVSQQLHRDLGMTPLWGYGGSSPGPTIEARTGTPVRVKWINNLPSTHLLGTPDTAMPGAGYGAPEVRTVVHLHGGEVTPGSDGVPEKWYTNNPAGPQLYDTTSMPGMSMPIGIPGNSEIDDYPNIQQAGTLWYHDHAMGTTRLNVVAGLAGFYLLRDDHEDSLNLPKGVYEIPIAIQDRQVNPDGTVYYPNPWSPEYFGDKILVNGKFWPFLDVEPRKYRFRFLDGSNARVYNLTLVETDTNGVPVAQTTVPTMVQIGTDGGLMSAPVAIPPTGLRIAPGERADIIVDFSAFAGKNFTLKNDAEAPFQQGLTSDGAIPDVMIFKVSLPLNGVDTSTIPTVTNTIVPTNQAGAVSRDIMMGEELDPVTGAPLRMLLNGKTYMDAGGITELPNAGSTEIWRFINTTMDTHPMHLHLVEYQVLDRQAFQVDAMGMPILDALGKVIPTGPVFQPDANEIGWKDTIQSPPGMITRVITQFNSFAGKYVYHCHILEHEENEMMRPFEVVAPLGNLKPTIVAIPGQNIVLGGSMNVPVVATDANGDALAYSLVGAPAGIGIDPATGIITGIPPASGNYTFTVKVSDGFDLATASFTLFTSPYGVVTGGSYIGTVTPIIPVGSTAILDGVVYASGTAITASGTHTLVITDTATSVATTITFNISAAVIGVTTGGSYTGSVTPVISTGSTATLDGVLYVSGTPITATGAHTLVISDGGGVVIDTITFTVLATPIIDTTPPTAEVDYFTTAPTSNPVVVELVRESEPITITNNAGRREYTFTENGSFTFQFQDAAGNTGSAIATVNNIDTTPPTANIEYSTVAPTSDPVTVTLMGSSEPITIMNNNGSDIYTFTTNGSFTFQFQDAAGNTGSADTIVDNIIPAFTPVLMMIDITPNILTIDSGSTFQLTAIASDQSGAIMNGITVFTWTSDNTGVVTVTSSGLVTGISEGTGNITATNGSVSSTVSVTVRIPQVSSMIAINSGWNLLSLPLQPTDASGQAVNYTAETFGQLSGADIVTQWKSSTQQYVSHIVGSPINDFAITNGLGFFVHTALPSILSMTGTALPQIIPTTSPGWNLLGYGNTVSTDARTFGLSFPGANIVSKWSNVSQQWISHIINFPLNNFVINPGDAAFVHKP